MDNLNVVHVFNNDVTKSYSTNVSAHSTLESVSDYFIGSLGQGLCFIDKNNGTYQFSGVVNYRNLKRFDLVETYYLVTGKAPYLVKFVGKEIGALGFPYTCSIVVMASNKEEARLRVYDTHEHCMKFDIECKL
jgi:hypothetical protein